MISNGMLDQAVQHAERNVDCLYPWAAAGRLILACEPSCILTIRDDYPALLRGESRRKAEAVAAVCQTMEQLLETRLVMPSEAELRLAASGPAKILVQGHCHQRALTGV